jgi:hypothetical protein
MIDQEFPPISQSTIDELRELREQDERLALRQAVTDNRSSRAELAERVERLEAIVKSLVYQLAELVAQLPEER